MQGGMLKKQFPFKTGNLGKIRNVSYILVLDYEYKIANKKQKLEMLQKDSVKYEKQYVS